jgi:hypothetical protein
MTRAGRAVALLAGLCVVQSCTERTPTPPTVPSPVSGPACGEERWSVKTLADADATRIDFLNVTPTTIADLNVLAAHCSGLSEARTFVEEFRVFEVTGVVLVARPESDHDVHIALADPADASKTMVVEVVDPSCATTSPYATTLTNARIQYQNFGVQPGQRVTVQGVGFFDFAHGQTGRSQSCLELHPVLDVKVRPEARRD